MSNRKTLPKSQTLFNPVLPAQIDPEFFLKLTKPQPTRAVVESALFQVELGTADVSLLYKSVSGGDEYSALLRWGYSLVSKCMSSGEIMSALHQLAFSALAAGWIACESGVQATLLSQVVSVKASSVQPNTKNDGRKAAEQ